MGMFESEQPVSVGHDAKSGAANETSGMPTSRTASF